MPADRPSRPGRLSRSADFQTVYRGGSSAQHRLLVVYQHPRPADSVDRGTPSRLGIVVSRKVGGAVQRNALKRRLREAVAAGNALRPEHDCVVIARPGLDTALEANGFEWLVALLEEMAAKASRARATRT